MAAPLLALIPLLGNLLDKIIPDPAAAAEAKVKLIEITQKGELAALDFEKSIVEGQNATNAVEAASSSLFRGGWRPAVGWVCATAFGVQFVLAPLLPWLMTLGGINDVPPLPQMDMEMLLTVLLGMLGLGGLRTIERLNGKA
jgi:hypothetical protein